MSPRFAAFALSFFTLIPVSQAAEPATGTLSPASSELSYNTGVYVVSAAATDCTPETPCDEYALTVDLPANYTSTNGADRIHIAAVMGNPAADYDLALLDAEGNEVGTSGGVNGATEVIDIPAGSGLRQLTVRLIPYVPAGASVDVTITLVKSAAPPPPTGNPGPVFEGPVPRYQVYTPPSPFGESAGEPSVGYNVNTKKAMYISGLQTLRATFAENLDPPQPESCEADWQDATYVLTGISSLDPILFTDTLTGRTHVSQLRSQSAGPLLVGNNSYYAFTDDDGETWTPGQIDAPNGSLDHQTVGGGPYPAALAPALSNPANDGRAVYYCSQAYVTGLCARSDTGGLTYNRPTPAYDLATSGCSSIHGHVKVGPDGTVYLPHNNCETQAAVSVSTDAGTTWDVRFVEGSTTPPYFGMHPSVAPANDGKTIYYCYINNNSEAHAAVSHDQGLTWENDTNLGKSVGLQAVEFPEVVAGDPDRAACGFLGTTTPGNYQALDFPGVWYLYMAHTYDGGKSWVTVDADPGDPVQHAGGIWNQGGASPNRNLLDFNEIVVDDKGYVIYGYADGCVGSCVPNGPNSFSEKANLARQRGGKPLYAAFDTAEPVAPKQACLAGRRDDTGSFLTWRKPDTGGAAISGYKLFRATAEAGPFTQVGMTSGKAAYNDRSADITVPNYFYRVVAVNSIGESLASNLVDLPIGPRPATDGPCVIPGVLALSDPSGDPSIALADFDIQSVSVSEPPDLEGKIVFSMKVASLTNVPPGWRWAVRFTAPTPPPPNAAGTAQEDFFVAMVTADGAAPSFTYGSTGLPNENAPGRFFNTLGDLEPESAFSEDGFITFVLDKAAIGNPEPGASLINVLGSVRISPPTAAPGTGGTNETIPDSTGAGSYVLRSANFCLANTAPLAMLTASAVKVGEGDTVNFSGAGSSDADAGVDTVAKFAFNFGDGSEEVEQAAATTTHRFAQSGTYPVQLFVTDSRGKVSSNSARVLIEVGKAGVVPTPGGPVIGGAPGVAAETGRFGGAMGSLLLLPFLVFGLRRRRV